MKLSVLTKDGEGTLYLRDSLVITEPSELKLKSATMYWNYNNINLENDFITVNGVSGRTKVTLEHGYWNFNDLKQKLSVSGVNIVEKPPMGKCKITADNTTNFENLGLLLGLQEKTELTPTVTLKSPSPAVIVPPNMVDINRGLKRVDIQCDIIDKFSNININGQPSDIMTSIPIPTDKTLKGSLCYYNNINTCVRISRGTYNSLNFKVSGNNGRYACDVLLELYIIKASD